MKQEINQELDNNREKTGFEKKNMKINGVDTLKVKAN